MAVFDAFTEVWNDLTQSTYTISSSFDSLKSVFNEFLLLVYEVYFYLIFLLFIFLFVILYIVLPIFLIDSFRRNKKKIKKIVFFDIEKDLRL